MSLVLSLLPKELAKYLTNSESRLNSGLHHPLPPVHQRLLALQLNVDLPIAQEMREEAHRLHGAELPPQAAPRSDAEREEVVERVLGGPALRVEALRVGEVARVVARADDV